jgi:hypothetical protein
VKRAETGRRRALRRELMESLAHLRSVRGGVVTDDEYQELRAEALDQLATRPRVPGGVVFAFVAFGTFGLVGAVWCLRNGFPAPGAFAVCVVARPRGGCHSRIGLA